MLPPRAGGRARGRALRRHSRGGAASTASGQRLPAEAATAAGRKSGFVFPSMFEVRRSEDDLSFLRNYLTPEIVQRLNLFAYGSNCTHPPGKQCPQCHTVVITARGGCFTSVDLMVEDSPLLCPMEAEQAPSFSLASSEAINRSETPSSVQPNAIRSAQGRACIHREALSPEHSR
jgi:hypothetical protein